MITPEGRDESIFEVALQIPPEQRAGYLAQACVCDAQLRLRVEAILREHERAGHFMADFGALPPGPRKEKHE